MFGKLSAIVIATTMIPLGTAFAAPTFAPQSSSSMVVDVQYGGGHKYSQRHYSWCASRYRSYDPETNYYWNNYGQRRQCRSPYM